MSNLKSIPNEHPQDAPEGMLRVVTLSEFLSIEFPPRENILSPWLPTQGLAMVHGYRGVGKTYFALNTAIAVATGGEFLRWKAPKPYGVLLIDGEMPGNALQERLIQIVKSLNLDPSTYSEVSSRLKVITPDLQKLGMPDLATRVGQWKVDEHITDEIDLVILDNLSSLVRSGKENESESWLPVQEWALKLRASGKSVLFIHHSNKQGGQRGTSKREDILDTVISLKRPSKYDPREGAVFEVHYEKTRGIAGKEVEPFEAKLTVQNGKQVWVVSSIQDSTYKKVVVLHKEGLTPKEIVQELGIHKSQVSRHLKIARENQDID